MSLPTAGADGGSDVVDATHQLADASPRLRLIAQLAQNGSAPAQYELGSRFEFGDGVHEDSAEAVRWYRRAAEQGHLEAQVNLGWLYRSGSDALRNPPRAAHWFRKAAERGHAVSQYILADMYLRGEGVETDAAAALAWSRRAAYQGHVDAQFQVAELLSNGAAGTRDSVAAALWYSVARKGGKLIAADRLEALADREPEFFLARYSRVRRAPAEKGPFVVELFAGDKVTALGVRGDWLAVLLPNKRTVGWLHRSAAFGQAY